MDGWETARSLDRPAVIEGKWFRKYQFQLDFWLAAIGID